MGGGGQAVFDPVTAAPSAVLQAHAAGWAARAALPARPSLTCANPLSTKQISENSNPSIYQITLPLARIKLAPKLNFEYNNI